MKLSELGWASPFSCFSIVKVISVRIQVKRGVGSAVKDTAKPHSPGATRYRTRQQAQPSK